MHRLNHYGHLAGIARQAGDMVTHDRLRRGKALHNLLSVSWRLTGEKVRKRV